MARDPMELDRFIWAITEQESGGDYSADNGQAVGKYQVLKSNVPDWTRQYLGHALTWEQFLADHAAQDTVARGRLTEYYDRYGPRGAASAWYSGDPNLQNSTRAQPGGPSIKAYVDQVIARMANAPAGGAPAAGGGSPAPAEQASSLFSFPGDVVKFFSSATDDLTSTAHFFRAFFQPSTYVRIGAGGLGTVLVIAGIVFLAREARE